MARFQLFQLYGEGKMLITHKIAPLAQDCSAG